MLYQLRHPNLPKVIDHFSVPGQGQYLAMEYIEGEDLQAKLDKAGGPLPENQVLPWIMQVCDALTYLHSQYPPIIHRDIKPANIQITPQGQAMLVDFGIAKVYDPNLRTTIGARAVMPGYSPNEQYGSGNRTDARTDIYSLGATLYTLLTDQVPPEAPERNLGTLLTPPRQINPALSIVAEQAILQALAMLPEHRFQSIAEFMAALGKPPLVTPTKTTTITQPKETPPPAARHRLPWIWAGLLGVLLLVVISLLSFLWTHSSSEIHFSKTLTAMARGGLSTSLTATAVPISTATPLPATPTPSATLTSPPASETPTPTDTPTVLPTAPPAATPVMITEWDLSHFTSTTSGKCTGRASACWFCDNANAAKMTSGSIGMMSAISGPNSVLAE